MPSKSSLIWRWGFGVGADGAGSGAGVEVEGAVEVLGDVLGDVPLGVPLCQWFRGHPGGEAFVEPEVIPPLHGDHVAEPLVGHLVGDDRGDAFPVGDGGVLSVEEKVGLAIGDAAEVLHCAGLEVGEGDHVELGHWVLDAEVLVVKGEDVLGSFEGGAGEGDLVGGGAGADGDAVGGALGALEVADEKGDEVGGHLRRAGEGEGVLRLPVIRAAGLSETWLVLEMTVSRLSTVRAMSKVALYAGSSNDGKARRASVASNWVTA